MKNKIKENLIKIYDETGLYNREKFEKFIKKQI